MTNGLAFYEAMAQIIPVLLIVGALEGRAFRFVQSGRPREFPPELSARWRRFYVGHFYFHAITNVALLVYVLFAEYVALGVLKEGKASGWQETVVWSSFLVLAGWLTAGTFLRLGQSEPTKSD